MAGKSLIVGFGSIGARHAEILTALGQDVAIVSRREISDHQRFADIATAITRHSPAYVVIANRTNEHFGALEALAAAGHTGTVLVEKPLFDHPAGFPEHRFVATGVAYNLRFHPLIQKLKTRMDGQTICSFQVYVGQYLPSWRPGTDYRDSYSARREEGGGALRDLSHDIDYALWMLGRWQSVAASGGRFSTLEITSDDVFSMLLTTSRCRAVTIQLNYLDRRTRREIIVNTAEDTFKVDLVNGTFEDGDGVERIDLERNTTYENMHKAMLSGAGADAVCSIGEALDLMNLLACAEASSDELVWKKK